MAPRGKCTSTGPTVHCMLVGRGGVPERWTRFLLDKNCTCRKQRDPDMNGGRRNWLRSNAGCGQGVGPAPAAAGCSTSPAAASPQAAGPASTSQFVMNQATTRQPVIGKDSTAMAATASSTHLAAHKVLAPGRKEPCCISHSLGDVRVLPCPLKLQRSNLRPQAHCEPAAKHIWQSAPILYSQKM